MAYLMAESEFRWPQHWSCFLRRFAEPDENRQRTLAWKTEENPNTGAANVRLNYAKFTYEQYWNREYKLLDFWCLKLCLVFRLLLIQTIPVKTCWIVARTLCVSSIICFTFIRGFETTQVKFSRSRCRNVSGIHRNKGLLVVSTQIIQKAFIVKSETYYKDEIQNCEIQR